MRFYEEVKTIGFVNFECGQQKSMKNNKFFEIVDIPSMQIS